MPLTTRGIVKNGVLKIMILGDCKLNAGGRNIFKDGMKLKVTISTLTKEELNSYEGDCKVL